MQDVSIFSDFSVTSWCTFLSHKRKSHYPSHLLGWYWRITLKRTVVSSTFYWFLNYLIYCSKNVLIIFTSTCFNCVLTDRIMYTEMFLHPDEFDYFHVRVDSDMTFCLKELRVWTKKYFGLFKKKNKINCVYCSSGFFICMLMFNAVNKYVWSFK